MQSETLISKLIRIGEMEIWRGITAESLAAGAAILACLAIVLGILNRIARTRAGRLRSLDAQRPLALAISAIRKPALLAAWGFGIACAVNVTVAPAAEDFPRLLRVAAKIPHAIGVIAIFWLIFRSILAVEKWLRTWAKGTRTLFDDVLIPVVGQTLRLMLPVIAAYLFLPLIELPLGAQWIFQKLFGIFLIGSVAFVIIKGITVAQNAVLLQYSLDTADNLEARKRFTQISVLRKIIIVITSVVAAGCILMLFDPVRQLGTSILASAGIAGVILGLAAQKTLGNLLAGIQIAFTQPIRLDDVVIIEGEFGRIEEITLTYVVVRLWDLRRMVVPINFFIENKFQNWTRQSSRLIGTIFLYADHRTPVDAVRAEFERLVKSHPLWDGEACGLQVTNCDRDTIELRCLAGAADAGSAFSLRCDLREKLIAFMQKTYPQFLPRVRAELSGERAVNP